MGRITGNNSMHIHRGRFRQLPKHPADESYQPRAKAKIAERVGGPKLSGGVSLIHVRKSSHVHSSVILEDTYLSRVDE